MPGLNPALPVGQAANIDTKVDDGAPQTGKVTARGDVPGGWMGAAPGTAAAASATTCYDNGGSVSNTMVYSTSQGGGEGLNCAFSFRFN